MIFPYEANTSGMIIRARPSFLPDESDLARSRFVWAYNIEIENRSDHVWKLTRRHWRIIAANGHVQTVDGDGVIGQMPVLEPGEHALGHDGRPIRVRARRQTKPHGRNPHLLPRQPARNEPPELG